MRSSLTTRALPVLGVAALLAGCAGAVDDAADAPPTTSATVVEATTEPDAFPSPSSMETPSDGDDVVESPGGDPTGDDAAADSSVDGEDVEAALAALEDARRRWDERAGELYVWGYTEKGEGMVLDFCVEGVVGRGASDAAACPFPAELGGRSVESWFDTIGAVLDDAPTSGRTADVVYADDGHPVRIVISGGEIDGLVVESSGVEFAGDADAAPIDVDALRTDCERGDAAACYELGAAGEPLPASLVTGNELTQAPDLDVLDRCGAGEPAACHEAGARLLTGD